MGRSGCFDSSTLLLPAAIQLKRTTSNVKYPFTKRNQRPETMFSKKGTQKKVIREKRNTTDAVVRYQKDTAGAAHANNLDEDVDDFVIIESM